MTNKELLINRINLLSEEEILSLLDVTSLMTSKTDLEFRPECPHCASSAVIRYGHKCGKQRFFCKSCGKTFVSTTHTIMENSHFQQRSGAKLSGIRSMATPLITLSKIPAAPIRQSLT